MQYYSVPASTVKKGLRVSLFMSNSPDERCGSSDEDVSVTMVDVENQNDQLSEYIAQTVGTDDLNECSYQIPSVASQSIHICITCQPGDRDFAGICSACSIECHQGHELYPIGPKRYFQCECGTSKFPAKCLLFPVKNEKNTNIYNHNFRNRFCNCNGFYDDSESVMYQCLVCEDWFHEQHLEGPAPKGDDDFVCSACVSTHPFLVHYSTHKSHSSDESKCFLDFKVDDVKANSSIILNKDWKKALCKCSKCYEMYIAKDLIFLLNDEDSKENSCERIHSIINPNLDEVYKKLSESQKRKFDTVTPYYIEMQKRLKQYLSKFSLRKQVVTAEDIQRFFEEFQEGKMDSSLYL